MLFHVLGLGNIKSWANKRSKTCNNNEMTPANISHKWFRLLCLLWIASAPPWLSSAADRTLTNSNVVVPPLKGCSPDDISDVMHLDLANPQSIFRSARTSWITFVRPFARPPVCKKNLDQLYSSINHHRTTANLSHIVWCMSGSCLVVSGSCLLVSGGVWCMSGGVWWCRCI